MENNGDGRCWWKLDETVMTDNSWMTEERPKESEDGYL